MRRISDFRKEKSVKSSVRGQKTTSGGIVENLTDFGINVAPVVR